MNRENAVIIGAVLILFVAMASGDFLGLSDITGKQVQENPIPRLDAACPDLNAGELVLTPSPVESGQAFNLEVEMKNTGRGMWLNIPFIARKNRLKITDINIPGVSTLPASLVTLEGSSKDLPNLILRFVRGVSRVDGSTASATFQLSGDVPEVPAGRTPLSVTIKWQMIEVRRLGTIVPFGPECSYTFNVHRLASTSTGVPSDYPTLNPTQSLTAIDYRVAYGEKYLMKIPVINSGTNTWTTDYRLEGKDTNSRVIASLPINSPVGPGGRYNFEYLGTAQESDPNQAGTAQFYWQMKTGDNKPFGIDFIVQYAGRPRENNALCGAGANDIQLSLGGQNRDILNIAVANIKNTGNTIWKRGDYKLISVGQGQTTSPKNIGGNLIEFDMPDRVALLGNYAPEIKGVAPNGFLSTSGNPLRESLNLGTHGSPPQPGIYDIAFRMKQTNIGNGIEFGPVCSKQIRVEPFFTILSGNQNSGRTPEPSTPEPVAGADTGSSTDSSGTDQATSQPTGNSVKIDLYRTADSNSKKADGVTICSVTGTENRLTNCHYDSGDFSGDDITFYTLRVYNTDQNWKVKRLVVITKSLSFGGVGGNLITNTITNDYTQCNNQNTCIIPLGLSIGDGSEYVVNVEVENAP